MSAFGILVAHRIQAGQRASPEAIMSCLPSEADQRFGRGTSLLDIPFSRHVVPEATRNFALR